MDVRRFPSRQDAESENPRRQLNNLLLLLGEKPLSLVTFFAAAKKVTRPRSGRKPCNKCTAAEKGRQPSPR
jgi:hypothetical protein